MVDLADSPHNLEAMTLASLYRHGRGRHVDVTYLSRHLLSCKISAYGAYGEPAHERSCRVSRPSEPSDTDIDID